MRNKIIGFITLVIITFGLLSVGSVGVKVKASQGLGSFTLGSQALDLSQSLDFNYSLSQNHEAPNIIISRENSFAKIKFQLLAISFNQANGKPWFSLNSNQKTTGYDLIAPLKNEFIQLKVNQIIPVKLSLGTKALISLVISSILILVVYLYQLLSSKLAFGYKISFPLKTSHEYSYCAALKFSFLIFLLAKLIFFSEFYFLTHYVGEKFNFINNLLHADSLFYLDIAKNGYLIPSPSGLPKWAFFPLFSLLIKLVLELKLSLAVVVICNQLCLFLSLWILFLYTQAKFNLTTAKYAVIFLSFGSENVYFMNLYTEGMFFFLSILSIYLAYTKRYYLAGIVAGLLSAARVVGVFYGLWILFSLIRSRPRVLKLLMVGILTFSGLLLYMLYMQLTSNDFLAFVHAQNAWRHLDDLSWFKSPLWTIYMTLIRSNLMDKLVFILSIFALVYFIKNKITAEAFILGSLVIVTFFSKSLGSFTRFAFACYPLYIFLAIYSANTKHFLLVLVWLLIMHFLYLALWLSSSGNAW